MYVKRILDFDEAAQEADVIVSDDVFDLLCYAHPFVMNDCGEEFWIDSLFTTEIVKTEENCFKIVKLKGYYEYKLVGEVVDTVPPSIKVGNILIELDRPLPKDIRAKDYIEIKTERLSFHSKFT